MPGLRSARRRTRYQLPHRRFTAVVKELTCGKGVDVILDMVAGDYLPREIDCLADDGRIA